MKKILISLLLFGWCFAQLSHESSSVTTLDHFQSAINSGNAFKVANIVTLGNTDTAIVVFDVADTSKYSHMQWGFSSSGAMTVEVIEGGACVRSPDALDITNLNGNSSRVSVMDSVYIVNNDSTLVTRYGADTLFVISIGGVLGGSFNTPLSYIAMNDSLLMFKMTSGAATNKIGYVFHWIEEAE